MKPRKRHPIATRHARAIRAGIHWGRYLATRPRAFAMRALTQKGTAHNPKHQAARRTYARITLKWSPR